MTTNGSSYIEERRKTNMNNIERWQNWSQSINYVVEQFNDVITNLSDRLNIAETTIQALNTKIDILCKCTDTKYVKLQYDTIQIMSSDRTYYTKTCGVFSYPGVTNTSVELPNIVYVYSTQSNKGVFVNNEKVYAKPVGEFYLPFTEFTGSDNGAIITIKTDNAQKIGKDLDLYFSINPSINSSSIGSKYDYTNNDIAKLTVKINYSQVVVKELITLDDSKLSQTIVSTIMPNEMNTIDKHGIQVGQYSVIGSPSNKANSGSSTRGGGSNGASTRH